MNRAANAGMLDANSHLPVTFDDSNLINTNTMTSITVGQGVFHGFLVIASGSGAFNATVYDVSTTTAAGLISTTAVGVLSTTSNVGVIPFQWGGDVIYTNGLVCVTTQGTAGAIKILYL